MTCHCHYCANVAVAYCDFIVRRATPIETCDLPICAEHRRKVGHICDRSRRTTNNHSDTIDHCRVHPDALGVAP